MVRDLEPLYNAVVRGGYHEQSGDPGHGVGQCGGVLRLWWQGRYGIGPVQIPVLPGRARVRDPCWFAYIEVDDIDDLHTAMAEKGADVLSPPKNEPWGMREFGVRTIDGHRIRFGSRIRREPRSTKLDKLQHRVESAEPR